MGLRKYEAKSGWNREQSENSWKEYCRRVKVGTRGMEGESGYWGVGE